jgi:hypothetical protein
MKATQNKTAKTAAKKTTTKVVDGNKLTAFDKKMMRLEALKQKQKNGGLNLAELKSLVNTLIMLEDKKPSAVYNRLNKTKGEIADNVKLVLGKSKMPSYLEFLAEITKKPKALYSTWDGINVLAKFNKLAVTKTKVETQNKKTAAI